MCELAAEWFAGGLSAQTAASWAPETVEVYRAWMHLGIGDANVAHSLIAAGLAPEDLGLARVVLRSPEESQFHISVTLVT